MTQSCDAPAKIATQRIQSLERSLLELQDQLSQMTRLQVDMARMCKTLVDHSSCIDLSLKNLNRDVILNRDHTLAIQKQLQSFQQVESYSTLEDIQSSSKVRIISRVKDKVNGQSSDEVQELMSDILAATTYAPSSQDRRNVGVDAHSENASVISLGNSTDYSNANGYLSNSVEGTCSSRFAHQQQTNYEDSWLTYNSGPNSFRSDEKSTIVLPPQASTSDIDSLLSIFSSPSVQHEWLY